MRKGYFPKKIDVLLKCLPESPLKKQLQAEIEEISKEAYLKGSQDCHDAMMKNRLYARNLAGEGAFDDLVDGLK